MELSSEFIEAQGLSAEQVTAITGFGSETIATLKQEWDTKANDNAEKIIGGAITHFQTENKIEVPRNQGEKYGDYMKRAAGVMLQAKADELAALKDEYTNKVKGFTGGADLKAQIETLTKEKDTLLQKYADFDTISEKAQKYDSTAKELSSAKIQIAFGNIKPKFPDNVNKYEADAKWAIFKNDVLDKFTIELVNGKAVAVDKENPHNIKQLDDLLAADAQITELAKGRQQPGTGVTVDGDMVTYKGVPFEVPEKATTKEVSILIKDYLAKKGVDSTNPNYANEFAKLNKAILKRETATA